MRDIKVMLDELGIDRPKFRGVYQDAKGEYRPCFSLPKRETVILTSGYLVVLRARVVDCLMELQARAQHM